MTWKKNETLDDSGSIYHWEALAKAMQNMTTKDIMQKKSSRNSVTLHYNFATFY